MKTNLKTYLSACLVMAAMGSCSHEAVVEGTPEKELRTVSLQAKIGHDSRIAFEEDETSLRLLWEENDAFSVMVGTAVQTPATFTLTEGAGTAEGQFTGEVYCSNGDTLYSVWPTMVGGMTDVHQCYWSLEGQQGVLDDQYAYMVGSGFFQEGMPLQMNFTPMTAAVRMHLVLPEDVKELVQVDVRVNGVNEGAWVNYDTAGLLLDSNKDGGVTINNEFTVVDGAVDVVAYFFAWQHSALNNGKVVVTDAEGRTYAGALVSGNIRPGILYDSQVELSFVETENITIVNEQFSTILQEILGSDKVTINGRGYAVIPRSVVEETKVLDLGTNIGNNKQLESLAGIEHFVNLEEFYFRNEGSSLVDIDFSKNLKLKNLQLVFPHPVTFDLSKNVELETLLLVGMTTIEQLDLSNNTKLTSLNVEGCCMETLDITPLTKLQDLYCVQRAGAVDTIDVYMTEAQMALWNEKWHANNQSGVNALLKENEKVVIENAELSLALKAKVSGYDIWINEQGFAEMKLMDVLSITSLDLSYDYSNPTQTKLTSLAGIEHFVNLSYLTCNDQEELTTCDLSRNTLLKSISFQYTGMVSCDLSKNINLQSAIFYWSRNLASLKISEKAVLYKLNVTHTSLSNETLIISDFNLKNIKDLEYGYTQGVSFDLSELEMLSVLDCSGTTTDFATIHEDAKDKMWILICEYCSLTEIDLTKFPYLSDLVCTGNQLTTLDVTPCESLVYLRCAENQLTTLNLSSVSSSFRWLECGAQTDASGESKTLFLDLKEEFHEMWKTDWSNGTNYGVRLNPIVPVTGGTSSGEDFVSGGNF